MTITSHIHSGLSAWTSATYSIGQRRSNSGNAYEVTTGGSSTSAPTGTGSAINNGGVAVWKWLSAINYTSIQAWRDAWPGTITQDLIGLVWNDAVITPVAGVNVLYSLWIDMAGFTATLKPAPGESFRDKGPNIPLAYDQTKGVSILLPNGVGATNYFDIFSPNFTIQGLQIKDPLSISESTIIFPEPGAFNFKLLDCIIDGYSQAAGADLFPIGDTATIVNTLFVDRQPANSNNIPIHPQGSGATILNCVSVAINTQNGAWAIVSDTTAVGSVVVRNHVSIGYANSIATCNTLNAITIDHSATDQAALGTNVIDGGNNLVSQTPSALFTNAATDFRPKSGSQLIGHGVVDTTDNPAADDIWGLARGATWDIGAGQFHAATASVSATLGPRATVTVPPRLLAKATASAAGVGGVAAAVTRQAPVYDVSATIGVVGSVQAAALAKDLAVATLASIGSVTIPAAANLLTGSTRLAQVGINANAINEQPGLATIAGVAGVTVNPSVLASNQRSVTALLPGVATVAPPARLIAQVLAQAQGQIAVQASAVVRMAVPVSATIDARGALTATVTGGTGHSIFQASTQPRDNVFGPEFSSQFFEAADSAPTIRPTVTVSFNATVRLAIEGIAATAIVAVNATAKDLIRATVPGAFSVITAASRALPQVLVDGVVAAVTLTVGQTARLQARALLAAVGRVFCDVAGTIGGDVEVPTQPEFDALVLRVNALEARAPQLALYEARPFYVVEITAARAPSTVLVQTKGYGTRPFGASARRTAIVGSTTSVLASDLGYRTRATDQVGVVAYPALVTEAFQIDRRFNLDPTQSQIGAAWGSISLSNAGRIYDGLAASWDNDGREIRVLSGVKSYDAARGYFTDPPYDQLRQVFIGLSKQWMLSETALDVPLLDAAYWLDRPYQTTTYGGGGGYDGTVDLAGMPLPRARGGIPTAPIPNVTPTLVDPINRIYQYSDGAGIIIALREGGATPFGYAGDTTDLYSGTTPSGSYRSDNSRALFQLGFPAQAQITADVVGAFPTSGQVTTAADLIYCMLIEDMSVPDIYVDVDSFSLLQAAGTAISKGFGARPHGALVRRTTIIQGREPATAPAGVYFGTQDRNVTGLQAVQAVLGSIGGQIIPTRSGLLRLLLLRALLPGSRPSATYDPTVLVSLTPQTLPANLTPMPYRFRVAYNHNYTVQTSGVSVSATPQQAQFVGAADRFASWVSPGIQAALRRPSDPDPVGGALLLQGDAQAVANRLGSLWGVRRRVYTAVLPSVAGLAREIGDVVAIRYPMDDLSNGRLGQIVGEQFDSMTGSVSHQLLV